MNPSIPKTCTPYLLALLLLTFGLQAQSSSQQHSEKISETTDSLFIDLLLSQSKQLMQSELYDSAVTTMNKALQLATVTHNKLVEAEVLLMKGKFELTVNNRYDKATAHLFRSLSIFDSLDNYIGAADCNLQLGIISFALQSYLESILYFRHTLSLCPETSKIKATAHYLSALAYSELDSFNKAIVMFDTAMLEYTQLHHKEGVLWCRVFIGKMYSNIGDHAKAIDYLTNLINMPDYRNDSASLMPAFAFLSTAYAETKEYHRAIQLALLAYRVGGTAVGTTFYAKECFTSLQKSYFAIGDIPNAYFYLNKLNSLKDSIYSNTILQGIGKMKSQYEFEQQLHYEKAEQEKKDLFTKKELEKQKLIRNSSLFGLTIMLLFALIFHNQRNRIQKGKKLSDKLLLNILPAEVADELKIKGYADAKQYDEVTVMFTDFKSFTLIAERLSPTDLVAELDTCFKAFDEIITRYGLEKIKTIGDSYMCAGGIPAQNPNHPTDIVNAALEIRDFMENLKKERKAASKEFFEIRIGIHTGPVVAGIVGVTKFAYDIWGDTVNIASRLEASGEPGKINISETTHRLLKNHFTYTHRGKIKAKHKGEIEMYFVEKATEASRQSTQ